MLYFWINKRPKFGQFYKATDIKWSAGPVKNHFFYFHPSKRDCSRLKGDCQRRADTGQPSKGPRFVYWCCPGVGKALSTENNPIRWMKVETTQLLFVQSTLNQSPNLSDRIQLVKFRFFIYSKLEPKISKIYRNLYISGKPRVWELTRCVYFRNTANTSEIMSWLGDMCFSLILMNVSYFL